MWRTFNLLVMAIVWLGQNVSVACAQTELPPTGSIRQTLGQWKSALPAQQSLPIVHDEAQLLERVIDPQLSLQISPGHSRILRTREEIERVSVSDPRILQVNDFNPFEIELIGGTAGQTTLSIVFRVKSGGRKILRYIVKCLPDEALQRQREYEFGRLQDRINEMFPDSQVQLIAVEDKLIIRGQARDAKAANDILSLLGRQFGNQSRQNDGNSTRNSDSADQGSGIDLDDIQLVNLLRVPGEHQVMLKVRIAELSRNAARELGVNFDVGGDSLAVASSLGGGGNLTAILDAADLALFLRAFSTHGYGKILAEPTLVAISGQSATFLAGGEFAVPTAVGVNGIGAATTSFRGFGTQLSFTPTVIDKDRIRLQVAPSFSTLNTDASVNGIPGLNSRSVETTVDLREGQWLAIAGLIQDEQGGQRSEVPLVGRIPWLGKAFATQNTSRDETELVVLVSPQLVHPLEPEQVPLFLPGMEITDPTDRAFFKWGQIEGDPGVNHRSTTWPEQHIKLIRAEKESEHALMRSAFRRKPAYFTSEKHYIAGPSGFSN